MRASLKSLLFIVASLTSNMEATEEFQDWKSTIKRFVINFNNSSNIVSMMAPRKNDDSAKTLNKLKCYKNPTACFTHKLNH